jgi:hypothetical protein
MFVKYPPFVMDFLTRGLVKNSRAETLLEAMIF